MKPRGGNQSPSFLLGTFCASLQHLEKVAFPDHEDKGTNWAEDALLLFHVNPASTLQLIEEALRRFPEKLYENNHVYLVSDLVQLYQKVDARIFLSNPIDETQFKLGYQSKIFDTVDETPEVVSPLLPVGKEGELNFLMGIFMGKIQLLQESRDTESPGAGNQFFEDLFLLFQTNLEGSLRILDDMLSHLPEFAVVGGVFLSLAETKELYLYLGQESLINLTLDKTIMHQGYLHQLVYCRVETE